MTCELSGLRYTNPTITAVSAGALHRSDLNSVDDG